MCLLSKMISRGHLTCKCQTCKYNVREGLAWWVQSTCGLGKIHGGPPGWHLLHGVQGASDSSDCFAELFQTREENYGKKQLQDGRNPALPVMDDPKPHVMFLPR